MPDTRLIGGPFDGQTVPVSHPRDVLVIEGDPVPEGMVARYRPTRGLSAHRFREYDRIVGRLPLPGDAA
jgi:hypothetical protein